MIWIPNLLRLNSVSAPSYVGFFAVDLGVPLMFTDFEPKIPIFWFKMHFSTSNS